MEHSRKFNELNKKYKMNYITKSTLAKWVEIEEKKQGSGITKEEYEEITGEELEEVELTLEETKAIKIAELSGISKEMIENGVTVEINGVEEHFSYGIDNGDQGNIDDLFLLANQTKLDQPYHADGGECKLYSLENITKIYIAQKTNKTHHTTYFNQMKQYINTLQSKSDIESIEYGDELIGEFADGYDAIMEQATNIIKVLIGANE